MGNTKQWKTTFFRFWFTQALSLFGSGLASFSVIWWITESTGSSTILASASIATLVPGIILGPLAGAIIDQLDRKWIMIVSDAVSAILALVLVALFWTNSIQLWHIIVINVLRSLAGVFQFPAVQSSTSLMVPKEHLARIAGWNQALQGTAMIATPPLGALLFTFLPIHYILGIDVLTAVLAICLLITVNIPQPQTRRAIVQLSSSVWQDMGAGFMFIKQWPALVNILLLAAALNLVLIPAFTLVPMLITQHFFGSAFQLGWINAAYGFGIVFGGMLLGIWGGLKRRIHTSLLGLVGLGIGSFMIGTAPMHAYWLAVAGMVLVGIMNTFTNGPFFAILQSVIPPEMQGRVFTVLMSITTAMAPIGLALAGALADRLGVQFWYILGSITCGCMAVWIASSPSLMHLEEQQIQIATSVEPVSD